MASSLPDEKETKKGGKKRKKKFCGWLIEHAFLVSLLVCTIAGFGLGMALKSSKLSKDTIDLIGFPGNLVLRAFMMIIVPLLFCSLVLGIASLRKGGDTKMVVITITFFLSLSTFAAIMGATAGHVVKPGRKITEGIVPNSTFSGRRGLILESMLDLLLNAVPNNIIEATFSKEFTNVIIKQEGPFNNVNKSSSVVYEKKLEKKHGVNFMGLLMFSILFGCALASMGNKGEQLHQVIEQLNTVVMTIMKYVLNSLPIGMFFWMIKEGLLSEAPEKLFQYLGLFLATAFGCIAFHQFVLLPLLYIIIVRKSPVRFHMNLLPAILTAFGTSSSAATLPATVKCAEESNKLNRCVTRFVLPLGMVIHMNGGTFYIPLSSVFLAQLEGITLGIGETVLLCLTSILLLISAPGTAAAGNPVYLLTAMAAAGIEKPQYITLILSMEWLMERFRTVMNVVADSYVAAFVVKLCENNLPEEIEMDTEYESPVLDGYKQNERPFTISRP